MSIVDNIRKTFQNTEQHKMFTSKEIKQRVHTNFDVNEGSVCPADRCYNLWNKDLEKKEWLKIFEYHEDNDEYEFLGEDYKYTGKVLHNIRGGKKVYIGEWNDGVFQKYDSPLEIEGVRMFNKDILKKYVAEYKENFMDIRYGKEHREIYKWEAVEQFRNKWNIDAVNFSEMFKEAVSKTYNLLTAAMFFPLGMLSGFAKKEPETVRAMFIDLYDESKDLQDRVSNFMFQADELHKRNPGGKSHYQGIRAISVYLWLKYPENYYIYQYAIYDNVVQKLEADYKIKKDGKPETLLEGFKFFDAIREELSKDKELVKMNQENGVEGFKDEGLTTLTEDVAFYIRCQDESDTTWFPSKKEYDPEITVEEWKELYNDEEVFSSDSKMLMNEMMLMGGKATCSQLAEKFLGDKSKFSIYNNKFINLGKRIQQRTGKDLFISKNDEGKNYWSILCVCKKVDKKSDKDVVGQYVFKLRDELQEALREKGLPFEDNGIKGKEEIMIKYPKNQILYGPPGTGKTYNTVNYAVAIIENKTIAEVKEEDRKSVLERYNQYKEEGLIEFCTFHQSFGYEEFIEGIKPVVENGNVLYKVQDGIFKAFCNQEDSIVPRNKVFIIDEINRGNISKIFGELITLIEDSKRIGADEEMRTRLPYSGELFGVPNNVYLLGTMNTADRSIALIDTALRRRFKFVEMQPKSELLKATVEGVNLNAMLNAMNKKIEVLYDREHTIGHSFFMGLTNDSKIEDLAEVFKQDIIPLLKEYFYDEYERIAEVLGDDLNNKSEKNFVVRQEDNYANIKNTELVTINAYEFNESAFTNIEAYKKIYE